ncbi:hypothetical protein BofuT4_uP140770.1 [Botrytis cinerea T4]|uniref:Uncharacterized protein n=1 Tax=Botryotinia fuckeliana (strain T4) TaxID=999810 RepID=G2YYW7_BOTF4|nr:hypothetical protein BofuT4_uP140770.1 [Botrytis cinerea T4]
MMIRRWMLCPYTHRQALRWNSATTSTDDVPMTNEWAASVIPRREIDIQIGTDTTGGGTDLEPFTAGGQG